THPAPPPPYTTPLSLHDALPIFDKAHHMYGGHAIVGAHVPLACGLAFACKYRNEDRLTLCFFGDGAINQGAFHEALNLAALNKRSEEHTSELQSRGHLVCRLLLE